MLCLYLPEIKSNNKMKNRILGSALAVTTLLFTACNKEEVIEFNQDINATIQGVTYDADGNVPLADVSVLLVGDQSQTSDEDGTYRFTGKETGSHLLKFEKEGFATMVQTVFIDGTELTAEEVTNSSIIEMFHTSETLSTSFKIDNGEEVKPAANADVTIELNSTGSAYFEDNKIETTTDANGALSLEGLPDVGLIITVETTDGTDLYDTTVFTTPDGANSSYTLSKSSLLEDFVLVDSNVIDDETGSEVEDFTATANIEYTFSAAIDANYAGMEVTLTKGGQDVAFAQTISGSTLTIDPIGTELEAGEDYTVSVTAQSLEADGTFDETYTFTVDSDGITLTQVTGLSLDNDIHDDTNPIEETDVSFTIQFDEVEDADSYEIYGLYSGATNEYVLLTATDVTTTTDDELEYLVNIPASGFDLPDDADGYFDSYSLTIIVRAKSGDVYGEFSTELEVEEGDEN